MRQKKRLLTIIIALCGLVANMAAQNLLYVDEKPFHFGFSVGLNMMDFDTTDSEEALNGEVYHTRVSGLTPGFSVGLIGNLRLSRYLDLRCTPTLHFGQRTVSYKPESASKKDAAAFKTEVISLPISVPIYLKYSAEREKNYRPYLIGGGGVYYDLGRDKERMLLLKPLDYFVEVGVGCDIYFPFFKLAPELKFSLGFNNTLTPLDERPEVTTDDKKKYTQALSKLTSRMLTLTFNFE